MTASQVGEGSSEREDAHLLEGSMYVPVSHIANAVGGGVRSLRYVFELLETGEI